MIIAKKIIKSKKTKKQIQLFFKFINESPKQILNEKKSYLIGNLRKINSKHLSFINFLKRQYLEPNSREIVEILQNFIKFYNLPLSIGFRGHIDLFLK